MMATSVGSAVACVTLALSTPARAVDSGAPLRTGVFTAEEYGVNTGNPNNQPSMPDLDLCERKTTLASLATESLLGRDERRRGIVINDMPCPLMIVTGTLDEHWPAERYDDVRLRADRLTVEGASHWGLVLNRRALGRAAPAVLEWIEAATA